MQDFKKNNFQFFNRAIYDLFFAQVPKGSHVILSIDTHVFNELCGKIDKNLILSEVRRLFRQNWEFAFKKDRDKVPNFLGLIGIQVYAACSMHKDNRYSARAYNPRLCDLLCIDRSTLDQYFYPKYQEKLWQEFESWAVKQGFFVSLPSKKTGPGRYIQYPLSQSLLNQEDLQWLPLLFEKAGLRPFEALSFDDFISIISGVDRGNFLTNHYYNLKEQLIAEDRIESFNKQIFAFYLSWSGELPSPKVLNTIERRAANKIPTGTLVFNSENLTSGRFKLSIYDESENQISEVDSSDPKLFEKVSRDYRLSHSDKRVIIFIKNSDYDDEWDESRFIEFDQDCLILLGKDKNYIQDFIHLLDKEHSKYSGRFYNVYKVNISAGENFLPCYEFLFPVSQKPFIVKNGLKLSRKIWMHGAGPDFFFPEPIRAWLDGGEINLDDSLFSCRDLDVGEHVLNVKDHAPFRFYIETYQDFLIEDHSGWQIDLKENAWRPIPEGYHISGMKHFFSADKNSSSHRMWIDALLGREEEQPSTKLVTMAITRAMRCKSVKNSR